MNIPLVSCVVINWNGIKVLNDCLDSILRLRYQNIEIIVVDNNSMDGSQKIKDQYQDKITWIQNSENLGYAKSCNIGIKNSRGKYIALLNNDVVLKEDWLDHAVAFLENHSNVGIISSCQISSYDNLTIDSLFHELIRSLIFCEFGHGMKSNNIPLSYVISANGASPIFRRELFDMLLGFDESIFAYHEECDLFFRALKKGWKCVYLPKAIVLHHRGHSFGKRTSFSHYHFERSRWIFLLKNYPFLYLIQNIHFLFGKELILFINACKEPKILLAHLRARLSVIRYFLSFKWLHGKNNKEFYNYIEYIEFLKINKYIPL